MQVILEYLWNILKIFLNPFYVFSIVFFNKISFVLFCVLDFLYIMLLVLVQPIDYLIFLKDSYLKYVAGYQRNQVDVLIWEWPELCKGTVWQGSSNVDMFVVCCIVTSYLVLNLVSSKVLVQGLGKYYHSGSVFSVFIYWLFWPKITLYGCLAIHLLYSFWFFILAVTILRYSHHFFKMRYSVWYFVVCVIIASNCLYFVMFVLSFFYIFIFFPMEGTIHETTFLNYIWLWKKHFDFCGWYGVFGLQLISVPSAMLITVMQYRVVQVISARANWGEIPGFWELKAEEPINVRRAALIIQVITFWLCSAFFIQGVLIEFHPVYEIPLDLRVSFFCNIGDWLENFTTEKKFITCIINLWTFISVSVTAVMQSLEWLYVVPEIRNGGFNAVYTNFITVEQRYKPWYLIASTLAEHSDGTQCFIHDIKFLSKTPTNLVTYINIMTPSEIKRIIQMGFIWKSSTILVEKTNHSVMIDIERYHQQLLEGTYVIDYL